MYERFTDRARKVMQLANQEAQRLCHEYIGTEHIALGLLKIEDSNALRALASVGAQKETVALAIEALLEHGPEMVTIGKLPQTPRAKKVIEYAIHEAKELGHNYVGTEHVLLGLLHEQEGIAGQELARAGLDLDVARKAIVSLLGTPEASDDVKRFAAALIGKNVFIVTDASRVDHEFSADYINLADGILKVYRGKECVAMFAQWSHWKSAAKEWTAIVAGLSKSQPAA